MLAFCAPTLAGSVLMQLMYLLDSAIVGRAAGVGAFAGIAAAAPVAFLATGFLMGVSAGFLIPAAQAAGAGDRDAADRFAAAALTLTAALSVLVAIPSAALSEHLVRWTGTPQDIAPDAGRYLRVVLIGIPVPLISMTFSGILRAEGDTRTPLKFQSLAMGLHLALDVMLVIGLRLGVAGAALASLMAEAAACALCARRVLRNRPEILRLARSGVRLDMAGKMLGLGAPIGLANLMASAGANAFQIAVNSLGSSAVAAVAAADQLLLLVAIPAMLLGGAMEVFSGQNYGANRPDRIRTGAVQLYLLLLGFLVPATLMMAAGSRLFVPLLIGGAAPEIIALARWYMLWCALFVPFRCLNIVLKGLLQGIGMPDRAVIASVYDLLARLWCAIVGTARFGFGAICAANPAAWALSALALVVACRAIPSGRRSGRERDRIMEG
jgi:putative MATE family efflux protein